MISAFGVDHGDIEKAFNPLKLFRGGAKAAGARAGTSTPMFDQLAAKHGFASQGGRSVTRATAAGPLAGGRHMAGGRRKGSYKLKSFIGGGGGARKA
jgi:hypothetical protein